MNQYDPLARLLYGAIGPAAWLISRILPEGVHPGLRAYRVVASLGLAPGRTCFASAILESYLRALLLQRHVTGLAAEELHRFAATCIDYEGPTLPCELAQEPRPIIFATPHYGAPVAALIAGAQMLQHRPLNVFFDKARHGSSLAAFFERAGIQASAQHGGLSGVRASLRALERGECVAILPDAFEDIAQTLVVPFFNRLLRVASGTACLALRSGALIVPAFAMPRRDFGLTIHIDRPIDPCRVVAEDEAQAIFLVTRLIFARIEEQLRFAPEHWRYWDTLPRVSTPLGPCTELDDSQLMLAIESRLYRLPPGARDIPELELLLR